MAEAPNTHGSGGYGDDQDDLVTQFHQDWRSSRDHTSVWRNDAREAFDMDAGHQWSEEDLMTLRDQQRPAVTFNRIARTVNSIVGTQVNNRQETRFLPREMGDVQSTEVVSAAAEWARDECDAEDEESDAFADMCICGMGWTHTSMEYEEDPDGQIRIDRVDPLEMYWDANAKKKNLADARWVARVFPMSPDEFESRWPDADLDAAAVPWGDIEEEDVSTRRHVYPQDAYNSQEKGISGKRAKNNLRVAHYQWCVYEDRYRVGQRAVEVTSEVFNKLKGKIEQLGIEYIKQRKKVWQHTYIAGNTILEEGESPFPDGPTYRAMTAKRDRNRGTWRGVVEDMKDPQRWGNKFFSQILDILNKNAKGGIMVETDAVEDRRDLEAKWSRPDAVHWMRPNALSGGKVQPKPMAEYPQGLDRLMNFALEGVTESSGINHELLGFADRNQPGIIEAHRKQAGLTILAPLFDAMRKYRKEQGRVLLYFINEYVPEGRLIRIMGDNGQEQYVPLTKQGDFGKYDVIVDEAPTSPNMKERVYSSLVQMLPVLSSMGVPLPPELLDYSPIPSALAQKWKDLIQQSDVPPEQLKMVIEQGKIAMTQLAQENQQLKAKASDKDRELDIKLAEADAKYEMDQRELEHKTKQAQAEIDLKMAQADAEIELKHKEAMADYEIELAKLGAANDRHIESMRQALETANIQVPKRRYKVTRNGDGIIDSIEVETEGHDEIETHRMN